MKRLYEQGVIRRSETDKVLRNKLDRVHAEDIEAQEDLLTAVRVRNEKLESRVRAEKDVLLNNIRARDMKIEAENRALKEGTVRRTRDDKLNADLDAQLRELREQN